MEIRQGDMILITDTEDLLPEEIIRISIIDPFNGIQLIELTVEQAQQLSNELLKTILQI